MSNLLPEDQAQGMPAPAAPSFQLSPLQLDLLKKRGLLSPHIADAAKAQVLGLDARAGLSPNAGFTSMLSPDKMAAPIGSSVPPAGGGSQAQPPPAVASTPKPKQQKPQQPKLTPEQEKQGRIWMELADQVEWVNPRKVPVGTQTSLSAQNIPEAARKLLMEMYPDRVKAGEIPLGWGDKSLGSMSMEQKNILAQLLIQEQQARRTKMLSDPKTRAELAKQGIPVPGGQ